MYATFCNVWFTMLQNNFKVQATRLQHEVEDIRRRVDHAKMKLTSEMKVGDRRIV